MWSYYQTIDFAIANCLFGAVPLTKNADLDKYSYSRYGIGFDVRSAFSLSDGMVEVLVKMLFFLTWTIVHQHTLITKKYTLILETKYSINFTELGKTFCLRLHYNRSDSFSFVNEVKIYHFKEKDSEIKPNPLHLRNTSKDFTVHNMKKTRLNGY